MRKITSLLVLLILAFVGAGSAMADVVAGKVYTIRPYSASTQYVVPASSWATKGGSMTAYATEATMDNGGQWSIVTGSTKGINGSCITPANPSYDTGYLNPWSAGSNTENGIGCWNSADGDQVWTISPVEGHEGVYTINNINNETVYMYYKADASMLYFNKPTEVGETNWFYFDEVEVTTPEVPVKTYGTFQTSPAPVGGAFVSGTKFYTIKVQRAGYLASDRSSDGYFTMGNSTKPTNDAGKWAFVETANGVQVYNKAAGANQVLTFQSSDNSAHCAMGSNLNAASSYFECVTSQNTQFAAGYECFKIKDTEAYWNHSNNSPYYLNVWTSAQALWGWGKSASDPGTGDAGSQFKIELAEELVLSTFTFVLPADVTVTYDGKTYSNGETVDVMGAIAASEVTINEAAPVGYEYSIAVNVTGKTVTVTLDKKKLRTLADIDPNALYTISSVDRGSFVYASDYSTTHLSGSKRAGYNGGNLDATDANFQFAFVKDDEGKTYLWSKGANKWAVYDAENVALTNVLPENGLAFVASTGGAKDEYPVVLAINGSKHINMSTDQQQGLLTTWNSTTDAGNMLQIVPVATLTTEDLANIDALLHPTNLVNITYEYSIDGHVFDHETLVGTIGEEFPAPTKSFAGYTLSAKPAGNVSVEGTHTITLGAFAGPFEPTTLNGDNFADGTKWYYMQNGNNNDNGYVVYTGGTEKKSVMTSAVGSSDGYKWAFVRKEGTPYFYLYNKAAGAEAMGEQLSTDSRYYPYHNQGFVVAGADDMPLELFANNAGYGFRLAGAEGTCVLGKHVGTNLSIWGNGASKTDNGSRFTFTEAPEGKDWAVYEARYNKLNACTIGENLGEYADVLKYLEDWEGDAPLSAWKNYFYLTLTYKEEANYDADMENMQWFLDHMQINLPQKGQLIRIKSSSNWMSEPTYLAGEKASNDHLKFVQNPDFNAEAEDNTIWIYDGQYLVNYANGLTFATTAAQYGHATLAMYPNTTAVSFQAAQNGTVGKYNVKFAGNRFMYTQNNNLPNLYTDAGSAANSEGYNFELEDATTYFFLDFGTNGWASGYFPIPVAANPEYGIEAAYYIKNDPENDCFQAEPVGYEGHGLIAPFTPVIIKVNSEINSGTPFVKGAPDYTMEPEPSALSGALWKQEKPANCLVFNVVNDKPGFYGYTGTILKHCKAYYEPSAPTESALRINFGEDDTLTGIMEAIEKAEFSGNVYDLQGRRINGVQKGVFVKDGKKVVK